MHIGGLMSKINWRKPLVGGGGGGGGMKNNGKVGVKVASHYGHHKFGKSRDD